MTFPSFPWYLVWLAAVGGLVGACQELGKSFLCPGFVARLAKPRAWGVARLHFLPVHSFWRDSLARKFPCDASEHPCVKWSRFVRHRFRRRGARKKILEGGLRKFESVCTVQNRRITAAAMMGMSSYKLAGLGRAATVFSDLKTDTNT